MSWRLLQVVVAAAACLDWSAAADADGWEDFNSCRNGRQVGSVAACDRVVEACRDFDEPTFNAAACPLSVYMRGDIGFSLANIYENRAGAYTNRQDFDSALADYERALAIYGKSPADSGLAYRNRGNILFQKGRYEDVVANSTAAIGSSLSDPAVVVQFYVQRAQAYIQLDKLELSRADLDRAIAMKSLPGAYLLRAHVSAREGKFDQAHADVATVLRLQPNDRNGLVTRGTIYRRQKSWDAALADFNKAIQLEPPGMPAVFERARLCIDMGEPDRALEDLDKILAGPTKNGAIYLERGLARLAKGDRDGAKSDFDMVLTYPSASGDRGSTHELAKAALAKM
jgi:tetratricopeptide (TPR) repeat protein